MTNETVVIIIQVVKRTVIFDNKSFKVHNYNREAYLSQLITSDLASPLCTFMPDIQLIMFEGSQQRILPATVDHLESSSVVHFYAFLSYLIFNCYCLKVHNRESYLRQLITSDIAPSVVHFYVLSKLSDLQLLLFEGSQQRILPETVDYLTSSSVVHFYVFLSSLIFNCCCL